MPYHQLSDLPESVRNELPELAQKIFLDTFNSTWKEYGLRPGDTSRAQAMAWNAVKQHYHRNDDGEWIPGTNGETATRRTLDQRRIM